MMDAVFIKIVNMSISAGWLILAVLALRLALKRAPRRYFVLLWGFVGLRLVLPFSLQTSFSLIPSTETVSPAIGYAMYPAIHSGSALDGVINPILRSSLAATPMNSVNPMQILVFVGRVIWLLGASGLLLYGLIRVLLLRRSMAEAVPLRDRIWLCDRAGSPFILGVLRPRIYLPSDLGAEETELVLAHEYAHLKRGDHLWKPLGYVLLSVYWFHPLSWAAYVQLCRDIEAACDEKVVAGMEMAEKKAYANALVSCSMQRRRILSCPLAFGELRVKERVRTVLEYKKPVVWVSAAAAVLCIAVAACFLTDPFSLSGRRAGRLGISLDMAIMERNRSSQPREERYAAIAYDVLRVSRTAGKTTVYANVLYEEYGMEGDRVALASGSYGPAAITFDTSSADSDASSYRVIEYWEPRDGAYYAEDIRARFPVTTWRRALDPSGAERLHEESFRSAREYYRASLAEIDYGVSSLYSTEDRESAAQIILAQFRDFPGCELHSLRYTSDECNSADSIAWMNELASARNMEVVFTQCIEFKSDFHSPVDPAQAGAWNVDEEYTNWQWWLAREDGGEWQLMTWGY